MAKYDVTPQLAETIKTVRIQNHVTSKSIAEYIGKSQSYMSKLEKGDIKTIKESELTSIFRFIFGSDMEFQDFLSSTLGKILDTLVLRFSDEDITEQIWFNNYDTVLRLIPIPDAMVDDLHARLMSLGLSSEDLCARINANEGISPRVTNTDQYPFNEWQAFVVDHRVEFYFIKMQVSISDIDNIFNKDHKTANYVTLLAITYYIIKTEKYGSIVQISDEEDRAIMCDARDYLNSYKFYSITEKDKLNREAHSKTERNELLSSFDKENISIINEILKSFRIISELDIVNANNQLASFAKNLNWDNGFIMRLLSIPFSDMEGMSFTIKKQMLLEIQAIAQKYKELPDSQKRIESYN